MQSDAKFYGETLFSINYFLMQSILNFVFMAFAIFNFIILILSFFISLSGWSSKIKMQHTLPSNLIFDMLSKKSAIAKLK